MITWIKHLLTRSTEQGEKRFFSKTKYDILIFLDFDGVLHPYDRGTFEFVDNFQRLLDKHPTAKVVISSSWRMNYTLDELKRFFDEEYRDAIIGMTPESSSGDRDIEILEFLEKNPARSFIAIDDDRRLYPTNPSWLFVVPAKLGLNDSVAHTLAQTLMKLSPEKA